MKRILGVDFGIARTGVAVTDPLGMMAQGVATISSRRVEKVLEDVVAYAKQYDVETIVVGLPKNMDGSLGERAEKTMEFKAMLERRIGLEVDLWDERLTTVAADRLMMEAGVRREDRKKYVDSIAATFILQGYLDRNSHSEFR